MTDQRRSAGRTEPGYAEQAGEGEKELGETVNLPETKCQRIGLSWVAVNDALGVDRSNHLIPRPDQAPAECQQQPLDLVVGGGEALKHSHCSAMFVYKGTPRFAPTIHRRSGNIEKCTKKKRRGRTVPILLSGEAKQSGTKFYRRLARSTGSWLWDFHCSRPDVDKEFTPVCYS
ncbi:hypothetical protein RRG08_055703 [Elysia crispata]|uniref:Uncharacterized protein n=1 Tax=Elysia crispata TaxID=231223 RepID=A0AAE1AZ86_9GAST|nr:hypothetical protein RRG08_055703 [Elysia crispata]